MYLPDKDDLEIKNLPNDKLILSILIMPNIDAENWIRAIWAPI